MQDSGTRTTAIVHSNGNDPRAPACMLYLVPRMHGESVAGLVPSLFDSLPGPCALDLEILQHAVQNRFRFLRSYLGHVDVCHLGVARGAGDIFAERECFGIRLYRPVSCVNAHVPVWLDADVCRLFPYGARQMDTQDKLRLM